MKYLQIALLFSISVFCSAQSWTEISSDAISPRGIRDIVPDRYIVATTDDDAMKELLWQSPKEATYRRGDTPSHKVSIMLADGAMDEFEIVEYSMMEEKLAQRYPNIRTYKGISTSDPHRRIRMSYTDYGLRALITDLSGQTFIDHYQRGDKETKVIYRREDYATSEDWTCDHEETKAQVQKETDDHSSHDHRMSGDCVFRSYRLAVTATGEYSNFHGATDAAQSNLVLSAMTVTVDRINDVFEQDITTRFILIGNVDDIFYYDSATDPFTGNSSGAMINENQVNTDAVIGNANYDLGHIFSTGGSGLAGLGVICLSGGKARGVTGIGTPAGDPFDIDYVAHEVGHQLGAGHTQNNACNRSSFSAREPGSASTIMGYAGICAPNVQNNSDAYFHAISVQQMNAEITSNSCHGVINLTNTAPVAQALTNKAIPHSTPFVLDVIATDPDNDALTYNWEQMDNEVGAVMPPAGTNTGGPMFRSKFATSQSERYFPPLPNVVAGTSPTWEVLPTVGRDMSFRVTVRDNTFGPGCTDEQDIAIEVINDGPFRITSQNTATEWIETELVTITWDVASTNVAPVSCSELDIMISYDGGATFTTTMATNVINDGSAQVEVPSGTTTNGRIMLRCADNVFYDVNDADITIIPGISTYTLLTNPTSSQVCNTQTAQFTVESTSILNYDVPITLSATNLPPSATASITPNPILPGNNATVIISNLSGTEGDYVISINGLSGSIAKTADHNLSIFGNPAAPTLSSPANNAVGLPTQVDLTWLASDGAISYDYELSTEPAGGNLIASGNTSTLSVTSPTLDPITTYYWRVRTNNTCGTGAWSSDFEFETAVCLVYTAGDLPIAISPTGTPTITSEFTISDKGDITDLNVVNLTGSHTWIADLEFILTGPDNTAVRFWDNPCGNHDNFNISFDDEAANSNWPCPPTDGGNYQPDLPLSAFDTKPIQGTWQLTVNDQASADGGSLDTWGISICVDNYCDLTVDTIQYTAGYGSLEKALECAADGDTIFLATKLSNLEINSGILTTIIDKDIVILADRADNITLTSEGNDPAIEIAPGRTVSLIGFDIKNIDATAGVIINNGALILEDVNVIHSGPDVSVVNQGTGTLLIKGDCTVIGG